MRDGGKGDKPRILGIPYDQFEQNWDRIFDKNLNDKKEEEKEDDIQLEVDISKDEQQVMIKKTWEFQCGSLRFALQSLELSLQ